jgi:hypothetical protein
MPDPIVILKAMSILYLYSRPAPRRPPPPRYSEYSAGAGAREQPPGSTPAGLWVLQPGFISDAGSWKSALTGLRAKTWTVCWR